MDSLKVREEHGIFRSERLVYRAPEPSDDQDLFKRLTFDRVGYATSSYSNNHLASSDDAAGYRKYCTEKCLIGAVICLPTPTSIVTQTPTTTPDDLVPIGEIHMKNFGADRAHHRNGEIGIQMLTKYQRQGYGAEAIRWLLKWAFHHTGLHRVAIRCFESNQSAIKTYSRCGFREEGREREAVWMDGRWQDIVCMSLLENEWRDTQKAQAGDQSGWC